MYGLYDLYDLALVAGWEPYNLHDIGMTYFLRPICNIPTDPAQHIITAGEDLDDISVDDLSVRRAQQFNHSITEIARLLGCGVFAHAEQEFILRATAAPDGLRRPAACRTVLLKAGEGRA